MPSIPCNPPPPYRRDWQWPDPPPATLLQMAGKIASSIIMGLMGAGALLMILWPADVAEILQRILR